MEGSNENNIRVDSLDIMKGIAILLMILGHSLPPSGIGGAIHGFIYSFHMPLFFIVSGYFYRKRSPMEQIKKDFFGLLLPYMVFCVVLTIYGLFRDLYGDASFPREFVRWFRICFYGSYNPNIQLGNWVGPIWFLIALFWCRIMFSIFYSDNTNKNIVFFILFPIFAAYIFTFIYVPLYLLQGMTSMIFYYIGCMAKENKALSEKCPVLITLIMIIIWIYCIFFSHIDMQSGYYDNFIINVIGAVSGTYFIYLISKFIDEKIWLMKYVLIFIGKMSLVVLCFHSLDYSITSEINLYGLVIDKIQSVFASTRGHYYRYYIGLRFMYIFIVLLVVPRIAVLKRLFSIK